MIDEKYLLTAFLAGMEWERSKNKLPIREAIAICIARIKKGAEQAVAQPTAAGVKSAGENSESGGG